MLGGVENISKCWRREDRRVQEWRDLKSSLGVHMVGFFDVEKLCSLAFRAAVDQL
jgi:hypothetical protein